MSHGGKRPGAGRPAGAADARPRRRVPRSDLAQRIHALLEQHPKWSQTKVAEELGVTRQAVSGALKRWPLV
jgi:DNA-binding transcriptional regulator LsrR (DeoR family)